VIFLVHYVIQELILVLDHGAIPSAAAAVCHYPLSSPRTNKYADSWLSYKKNQPFAISWKIQVTHAWVIGTLSLQSFLRVTDLRQSASGGDDNFQV
jgi:hypothetical protein